MWLYELKIGEPIPYYSRVIEGKKGNPIFLRKGNKAIVAVNLKYRDIQDKSYKFVIEKIIKETENCIIAEVTPVSTEPKPIAYLKLRCNKCPAEGSIYISETDESYSFGVWDVFVYYFKWQAVRPIPNKPYRYIEVEVEGCPHVLPFAHSYLLAHGYKEFAEQLIKDYIGENILVTLHGWCVPPALTAKASYDTMLASTLNPSIAKAVAEEAFQQAWEAWEKLSDYYKDIAGETIKMVIEGIREKVIEVIQEKYY